MQKFVDNDSEITSLLKNNNLLKIYLLEFNVKKKKKITFRYPNYMHKNESVEDFCTWI